MTHRVQTLRRMTTSPRATAEVVAPAVNNSGSVATRGDARVSAEIDRPVSATAEPRGPVPRIAELFQPYRLRVVAIAGLVLLTAGLGVVNPVLIRQVFDSALFPPDGAPRLDLLWLLAGVMTVVTVLTGGLGIVQTSMTTRLGQQVMRDLRDQLYRHLQHLSLRFFTGTRTGE